MERWPGALACSVGEVDKVCLARKQHRFAGTHVTDILFSWAALAAVVFGYLLGSVPFGLLLTRAAGLGDVRKIGSGNIGATNVLRTGNKGLAAATLLLDALKATVAVLIVQWVLRQLWGVNFSYATGVTLPASAIPANYQDAYRIFVISALAGASAFVGHIYPVWLGFKGGKGVATFIGAALGIFWPSALFFCLMWLAMAALFRYSSVSGMVSGVMAAAYPFLLGEYFIGSLLALMVGLIFYKHEANIKRLLAGEEPKIGAKKG
jgi:acyl phosphate:glycerol-3-phosphate acyltransferase